jgi:hypothetical protein
MIPGLPAELQNIGDHLVAYGYRLEQVPTGWRVTYPEGHRRADRPETIENSQLGLRLLAILRDEEIHRGSVRRYEQFDRNWGRLTYGHGARDSNMAAAGCGPTSLAIVLNYLMNDPLVQTRPQSITPRETMEYAADHGRVSGNGTDGNRMIRDLHAQWPQFDGRRVSFNQAARLVESGHLIIFLCRRCRGYSRGAALTGEPDRSYPGHYMVLAGVQTGGHGNRVFYVLDPGGNANRGVRYIREQELMAHNQGFWWVFAVSPEQTPAQPQNRTA